MTYEHPQIALAGTGAYFRPSETGTIALTTNAARTEIVTMTLHTQGTEQGGNSGPRVNPPRQAAVILEDCCAEWSQLSVDQSDAFGRDLRLWQRGHAGRMLPDRPALDTHGDSPAGCNRLWGLICIIMMLPLAIPIVILGILVGYFIVEPGPEPPRSLGKLVIVLFALLPAMVGAEHVTKPEPLLFTCETSVVVDAPPGNVWRHVVCFSDLDPPNDWLFHTGVAYPVRARIEGTGVGAVRRCEFSTGAFVEPIEGWDEPRLLRFAVTSNPPPMQEWNPLSDIHSPHSTASWSRSKASSC